MKAIYMQENAKKKAGLLRFYMAILCLLLFSVTGLTGQKATSAYGQEDVVWSEVLHYESLGSNGVAITGLMDTSVRVLELPEEIEGCTVTKIGENAFRDNAALISVVIPATVTEIGEGAFGNCESLLNLTIPASVTAIGDGAFGMSDTFGALTVDTPTGSVAEAFAKANGVLVRSELMEFFAADTGRYGMWDLTYTEFIELYESIGTGNDLFVKMLKEKGARHTDGTIWYDYDGMQGIEIKFADVTAEKAYALHYAPFEYNYADYQSGNYAKSCMEAYEEHSGVCEVLAKLYTHFVGTVLGEYDWQYRVYKNMELNHAALIVMTEDGRCFQIDNGGVDYWWLGLEVTPDYDRIGAYTVDSEAERRFYEWKDEFVSLETCYWYNFVCYVRYENDAWVKRPIWYNYEIGDWDMYMGHEAPKYYTCTLRGIDEIISLAGYTRTEGYEAVANLGFTTPEDESTAFVTRLYEVILGREADAQGLADWTGWLRQGSMTGVEVAEGFIMSDEFLNKGLSNEEFVKILYRAFFGREADEGGLATWKGLLDEGCKKAYIFAGFANSNEFGALCAEAGITQGRAPEYLADRQTGLSEQDYKVWCFVERMYMKVLERTADEAGVRKWVDELQSGTKSGVEVADGFLMSEEFLGKNMTNRNYVQVMYRAFFDRDADPEGLATWTRALANGWTKQRVFAGFANSNEFGVLCEQAGVIKGTAPEQ